MDCFIFTCDKRDFPEQISKVMLPASDTNENWFVDFKAGNQKYIVLKDRIFTYQIGNQAEKRTCMQCVQEIRNLE